jgi:hypothetical protein
VVAAIRQPKCVAAKPRALSPPCRHCRFKPQGPRDTPRHLTLTKCSPAWTGKTVTLIPLYASIQRFERTIGHRGRASSHTVRRSWRARTCVWCWLGACAPLTHHCYLLNRFKTLSNIMLKPLTMRLGTPSNLSQSLQDGAIAPCTCVHLALLRPL